jgi:hypothetical protein
VISIALFSQEDCSMRSITRLFTAVGTRAEAYSPWQAVPPVHLPASAGAGRHQRAGRVSDPLRRHPAQGLGWQPDLDGCASAVGADVCVADLLAAGTFGPRLPQSTPAGQAGGPGLAPGTRRARTRADQKTLSPSPLRGYYALVKHRMTCKQFACHCQSDTRAA